MWTWMHAIASLPQNRECCTFRSCEWIEYPSLLHFSVERVRVNFLRSWGKFLYKEYEWNEHRVPCCYVCLTRRRCVVYTFPRPSNIVPWIFLNHTTWNPVTYIQMYRQCHEREQLLLCRFVFCCSLFLLGWDTLFWKGSVHIPYPPSPKGLFKGVYYIKIICWRRSHQSL